MKEQKGITLIALVITIIVLLILAGVSIAMLTGENGLLKKAKGSGAESKVSEAKEYVMMAVNELVADFYEKKYDNDSSNDPTETTAEAYVAAKIGTKLTDTTLVKTGATAAAIELVPTDKDGKNVKGSYDSSTGKITWTATAAAGSGSVSP